MKDASLAGTTLNRYYHVCSFFNSRDEEFEVLGPFLKEGIDWGEKSLQILNPDFVDDQATRLEGIGVDVCGCKEKGQLELHDWNTVYLQDGRFDSNKMLTNVEGVIAAGKEKGYPRSRIIGHMGWAFLNPPGSEDLIEYEARVNEVLSRTRQPAVCVYDIAKLSGTMMMDILRAHPLTLVGGVVHENPFYTPPETLLQELRARKTGGASSAAPQPA